MTTFFLYLIKSVICLTLFYTFYMVLLSRETFHRFNRMALISILVASALIPVCRITTEEPLLLTELYQRWEGWLTGNSDGDTAGVVDVDLSGMETAAWMVVEEGTGEGTSFSFTELFSRYGGDLLFALYALGILFFVGRHAVSLVRLFRLLRKGRMLRLDDGSLLCLHPHTGVAPFSWMKYIVISELDYQENGRQIVAHEQAHIRNGHSWDLLLVELCLLLQWFNPAAWLIRQELQNIHEYEADEAVIRQGIDAKQYQLLIIEKAVGARLYSLANSLNHSSLKKRLTMMMKEKSHPWARLKYLYVLPLAAISMVAFAHTEAANNSNGVSEAKVTEFSANGQVFNEKSTEEDQEEVFMVVEEMPEYPGGMDELMKFLQQNIRYPKEAQATGVQGRVVVQFIVDKTGVITNPTIMRSVSPELDAEAIRIVNAMPQWKPGKQRGKAVSTKFTIPIQFRLSEEDAPQGEDRPGYATVEVNSRGEYLYGPAGSEKKGTLDEVAEYVKAAQKPGETTGNGKESHFKVRLKAHKDAPQESVDKLKEKLREIWALRIDYSLTEEDAPASGHQNQTATPRHNEKDGHTGADAAEEVFMVVEEMPEYPGGMDELMKFIMKNIKYPDEALQKGEEGRVIVQFVVGKDGKLRDFEVKRSVSPALDAEAIRVLKAMPDWKPGKQRGKAVDCQFNIPVQFRQNKPEEIRRQAKIE